MQRILTSRHSRNSFWKLIFLTLLPRKFHAKVSHHSGCWKTRQSFAFEFAKIMHYSSHGRKAINTERLHECKFFALFAENLAMKALEKCFCFLKNFTKAALESFWHSFWLLPHQHPRFVIRDFMHAWEKEVRFDGWKSFFDFRRWSWRKSVLLGIEEKSRSFWDSSGSFLTK